MPQKSSSRYVDSHGQTAVETYWTGGTSPAGSSTTISPRTDHVLRYEMFRSWSNTPGYRSILRKRRPHLEPQPFSFAQESQSGWFDGSTSFKLGGSTSADGDKFGRTIWSLDAGALNCPRGFYGGDLVSDDDLFLAARVQLKDRRSWNAPLFLAEMGKTSSMIVNSATKIVHALRAVKKGRFGDLSRAFVEAAGRPSISRGTSAANAWLQYKYGWKPLLKDVYDASTALSELTQRWASPDSLSNVTVRKSRFSTDTLAGSFQGSPEIIGYLERSTSQSKRLICRYYVNDKQAYTAASLGLTNPLSVAWELVPFSFVADWFAPVGDYLSSLDAGIGVTISSSWLSHKEVQSDTVIGSKSSFFDASCSLSFRREFISAGRRSLGGLPQAVPTNLTVHPNLGASQLTSAIALMRQITGKR